MSGTAYSQVPQIERDALIALYNSTDGANWKDNAGWLGETGTECAWKGVTCSSGVVSRLSFYENSLTGAIPTELGNLSNLTYLYLGYDSLSGSIPKELGKLSNLTTLLFAGNSLSGSIPKELGTLTNLTELYLDSNSLSGTIPSELGNLTKLTTLDLGNNSLTGSIPSELGNLTNLTYLTLAFNSHSGTIPTELGNLTNLTWLNLSDNSLTGSIPAELGKLTNLTNLNLSANSLSGSIPVELGNLTNLTYLSLGSNSLSGNIPAELGNLTKLTSLSLSDNSLSGSIPAELGNLTKLTSLSLYDNSLSGSIPALLGNLTNLTLLYLDTNSLTGSIPAELGNLKKLNDLNLNSNKFRWPKPAWLNSFTINDSAFDLDADKDGIDDRVDTDRNSVTMIKKIVESDYSLSILGSGRVVNLVSKSLFNETSSALTMLASTQITKILYSHLKDEFDFLMIAANNKECCSDAGYYGRFYNIQNGITGLGESIFDSTASYGSTGKLQGVIHFPYLYGLTGGPGLHEIAHNWGNYLIKTEVGGHWGYSNVGGQLGGWQPNSLVTLDDGTYQTKGPLDTEPGDWGSFANNGNGVPYSNLELYIMGMIGADEVGHDIKIAEDFEWTTDYAKGIFNASSITTLTMDQIIADKGIREPNHLDSQKNFRAMYVVVSEVPLTREEWRIADKFVYDFQLKGDDGNSTYNFWEATQGKGTMSFDQIDSFLTTTAITRDPSNDGPVVKVNVENTTIEDSDGSEGEFVNFTASAVDSDGSVTKTEWLINDAVVATGMTPIIRLSNGVNKVTFSATDDDGKNSTTTATITVEAPAYTPTEEWPSPYNGVTPDLSFGLAFNNIGVFNSSDATIYACLRLFTNGLPSSSSGISQFDIGLKVVSLSEATVQITKSREFNTIGALNEKVQAPDCSGIFETTTGLYTDIIQVNSSILETVWSLIDSTNLILKLVSSKDLTAN